MVFIVKLRKKGTQERFRNVRGGSAEGSRTLTFKTKRDARNYSEQLTSFNTTIEERKKPVRKKSSGYGGVFGSFKGF